jgi:hypothetical protein
LTTSFDGPEDDGKLHASLQEDTTDSNEETREENRTTSKEENTAETSKEAGKAKKGSRKADKSGRKTNKAQKAGNKGDRKVAMAVKVGNSRRGRLEFPNKPRGQPVRHRREPRQH